MEGENGGRRPHKDLGDQNEKPRHREARRFVTERSSLRLEMRRLGGTVVTVAPQDFFEHEEDHDRVRHGMS